MTTPDKNAPGPRARDMQEILALRAMLKSATNAMTENEQERDGKVLVPTQTLLDVLKYLDGVRSLTDADWNAVDPLRTKIRAALIAAVPK